MTLPASPGERIHYASTEALRRGLESSGAALVHPHMVCSADTPDRRPEPLPSAGLGTRLWFKYQVGAQAVEGRGRTCWGSGGRTESCVCCTCAAAGRVRPGCGGRPRGRLAQRAGGVFPSAFRARNPRVQRYEDLVHPPNTGWCLSASSRHSERFVQPAGSSQRAGAPRAVGCGRPGGFADADQLGDGAGRKDGL